jgi:hypothetical protein
LFVRLTEEYKAGRNLVDAIETTEGNLMAQAISEWAQPSRVHTVPKLVMANILRLGGRVHHILTSYQCFY